jgi:hypothetical protein
MKNKVLVHLVIPEIDEEYDIFIPINIRIGTIIELLNKSLTEITNGIYTYKPSRRLYNTADSNAYDLQSLVRETNIRNATTVVLM